MSNTSTVTPYESDNGSETTTSAAITDIFSWLGDTDEDRAIDQQAKQARNRQLYKDVARARTISAPPVVSIELHMKTADSLMRCVGNAGYKVVQEVQRLHTDILIIQSPKGDRVAVEQMHHGGVRLYAAHSKAKIDEIMRRHTVERAIEHLAGSGLLVTRKDLPNGEVQLLARKSGPLSELPKRGSSPEGNEELHAQIHRDGSTVLDVVDVKGPRCEEIAKNFAAATSGQITCTNRKGDYYCLPGELRRERVRAK